MKYRRIDKDTVQCIVTAEDLEEYGLSMTDIFERNERGEGFLRELIEEAHEEVGYTCSGNNIAMQISPFKDNGMIVTFSEEPESTFKHFLEHMKEVFAGAGAGEINELHENGIHVEAPQNNKSENNAKKSEQLSETRVFEFKNLDDVISFSAGVYGATQIKSCLVKCDNLYYLVLLKNRMSWKNFNKLSAKAFEFSKIVVESDEKLIYLGEHGDVLIENGAVNKLSKL